MPEDRRDDWQAGVDQKLMALTTSERVQDDQIDDLDVKYAAMDKALRGDPENEQDGLISQVHAQEKGINELKAELRELHLDIHGGRVGDSGLDQRMTKIEGGETIKGFKWQFGTAVTVALVSVIVAIISLLGLLITNWNQVERFLHRHDAPTDQLPPGKRRGRVRSVAAPEERGQTWR